jgi:hypothetical protein
MNFTKLRTQCRRSIHLFYTANQKPARSTKHLKHYILADFLTTKNQHDARLDLWAGEPPELIRDVKLGVVLSEYLRPGTFLTPETENHDMEDGELRVYRLEQIDTKNEPTVKRPSRPDRARRRWRGAFECHFHNSTLHFNDARIWKAWHTLKRGLNAEFHVRVHAGGDLRKWLEENLHLRPDVIGRAMPEASGFVVSPQENGKEVCWVIGHGSRAMDGSLMPRRNISEGLYSGRKRVFSWRGLGGGYVQKS